ncbi:uncharacterized protein Bfra_011619sa [Botrytis fragariae]|uniref:Uncharacterized protein n=1 Tax=Botrytis fragariae TaxID=1964551 RepID=A0A8H6AK37_9HELO|nr:uncharacterized protein Bfra_011619sa [Botrytis fragariae]KAF5869077.1 hypothetical protein Bfra_011619sa [Botrytis fragariae]
MVHPTLGFESAKVKGLALDHLDDLLMVESNGSNQSDLGEICEVEFGDEVEGNQIHGKARSASISMRGDKNDVTVNNLKKTTITSEPTKSSELINPRDDFIRAPYNLPYDSLQKSENLSRDRDFDEWIIMVRSNPQITFISSEEGITVMNN